MPVLLPLGSSSALTLLVTRVLADHPDAAVAADDLALLTDFLDAGTNLHGDSSLGLVAGF
jgi:mevalonate kinase